MLKCRQDSDSTLGLAGDQVFNRFSDTVNMKNLVLIASFFAVLGCSSFSRGPASITKSNFKFDLYGGNAVSAAPFKFQLLNLDKLSQQKVEFTRVLSSDPRSAELVDQWQLGLQLALQAERSYQFEFKTLLVNVGKSDIKNTFQTLIAIDETETDPDLRLRKKLEVISAFNELFKDSMDTNIEIATLPLEAISRLATPAIPVTQGQKVQLSSSSIWSPREKIDMWKGPGSLDTAKLDHELCTYDSPKRGFGVHAGFKVKCFSGKERLKVKFGNEVYSGPFNSRIFHRLGYNVPAIHYVPALKIAYDRRIFSEINSRKRKFFHIRLAGKRIHEHGRLKKFDTLEFVKSITLKDGKTIEDRAEIRQNLLKFCPAVPCDYSEANINTGFEQEISFITLGASTVTEDIGEELGPWNYSGLDHPQRSEIKALMVLGAWTGNFDLRKDNTNLIWLKKTGELKHFISDPGSGLGLVRGIFRSGSKVEDLAWQTTEEVKVKTDDQEPKPQIDLKYKPIEENEAFRKMSYQDAQWMVEQIAGVDEDELSQALAASGLSAAEFLLAREKLMSIQQKMIQHFGLSSKFAGKLKRIINKKISFDPLTSPHIEVRFPDGRVQVLEHRNIKLSNGVISYPLGSEPRG